MNWIAFDTTHDYLTVAAKIDGKLVTHEDTSPLRHSVTLMPSVDALLGAHKTSLGAVGVGIGPGSFTGIRIGVTTAKVLAWTYGIPVVAFTSAELAAYKLLGHECVAVINGGNRVKYVQHFAANGEADKCTEVRDEELDATLASYSPETVVIGHRIDGHPYAEADFSAVNMAALTETKLAKGEVSDCYRLEPLYIQLSQAEKERM